MLVLVIIEAALLFAALAAWSDARRRRSSELRERIARYSAGRMPETGP